MTSVLEGSLDAAAERAWRSLGSSRAGSQPSVFVAQLLSGNDAVRDALLSFLTPREAALLASTCAGARAQIDRSPLWLEWLRVRAPVPEGFSTMKLYSEMLTADVDPMLRRALLDPAQEGAGDAVVATEFRKPIKRVPRTPAQQLETLVTSVSTFPTAQHVQEALKHFGRAADRTATLVRLCDAALSGSTGFNKTLFLVCLSDYLSREGVPADRLSYERVARAAAAVDVASVALLVTQLQAPDGSSKIDVTVLKEARWRGLKPAFKRPVRRLLFDALLERAQRGLSYFISGLAAQRDGLHRWLLRSLHVGEFVEKGLKNRARVYDDGDEVTIAGWGDAVAMGTYSRFRLRASPSAVLVVTDVERVRVKNVAKVTRRERGLEVLAFFAFFVRSGAYPKDEAEFERVRFGSYIHPVLKAWAESDDFIKGEHAGDTLRAAATPAFQPELAGKKLRRPLANTLSVRLAVFGNKPSTWASVASSLSSAQIKLNAASLIAMGVDPSTLRYRPTTSLEAVALLTVVEDEFGPLGLEKRMKEVRASGELVEESAEDTFVRYTTQKHVKDKLGRQHTVERSAYAAPVFMSQDVVQVYETLVAPFVQMVYRALEAVDAQEARPEASSSSAAHLFTTRALARNAPRAGAPPSVPSYSLNSLWRGETLDLGLVVDKATFSSDNGLVAGITWCAAENGNSHCDLDLSLIVLDEDLTKPRLDQCTYTMLEAPGLRHSGDVVYAPYPTGGREHVSVAFGDLVAAHPTAKYVLINVFDYSNSKFDQLHDCSVFLAHPNKVGSGPGGMDVFQASRLVGSGRTNYAALLIRENMSTNDDWSLLCLDHALLGGALNVEAMGDLLARMVAQYVTVPKEGRRLTKLTCWELARRDDVEVVHSYSEAAEGGGLSVTTTTREKGESRVAFYRRLVDVAVREAPMGSELYAQAVDRAAKIASQDAERAPTFVVGCGAEEPKLLSRLDAYARLTPKALSVGTEKRAGTLLAVAPDAVDADGVETGDFLFARVARTTK